MFTCNICAETVSKLGFSCVCKNRVCISCEVSLDKCPFCRCVYPKIIDRMNMESMDEYIHSAKEKDTRDRASFKEIDDLLEYFEQNFFDAHCFDTDIVEKIEDDDEKYKYFFNGLKYKMRDYHSQMWYFESDILNKIVSNIYDILVEMSCDVDEIDELVYELTKASIRVEEAAEKKILKKFRLKDKTKRTMTVKTMSRMNNKSMNRKYKRF